jgi:hypothetical protein
VHLEQVGAQLLPREPAVTPIRSTAPAHPLSACPPPADKLDCLALAEPNGDKLLLITTGTFTAEARREATRDGAPPIDLIDGEQLCELLKEHQLGVRTTERTVEEVDVVETFFANLG